MRCATAWMVAIGIAGPIGAAGAAPPLPVYGSHVTALDAYEPGVLTLTTGESVAAVCAWYRTAIKDGTGEHTTSDEAHIFYTLNGATVDIEPGTRFDPGTKIGLSWDAKKSGVYLKP